mmetsp:Transcript_2205/g.5027  ORF Transcript_2205/g.5027 Transcript_2205/m.5027 type:complete len:292 (-) Transcript_2205:217-1092(-)
MGTHRLTAMVKWRLPTTCQRSLPHRSLTDQHQHHLVIRRGRESRAARLRLLFFQQQHHHRLEERRLQMMALMSVRSRLLRHRPLLTLRPLKRHRPSRPAVPSIAPHSWAPSSDWPRHHSLQRERMKSMSRRQVKRERAIVRKCRKTASGKMQRQTQTEGRRRRRQNWHHRSPCPCPCHRRLHLRPLCPLLCRPNGWTTSRGSQDTILSPSHPTAVSAASRLCLSRSGSRSACCRLCCTRGHQWPLIVMVPRERRSPLVVMVVVMVAVLVLVCLGGGGGRRGLCGPCGWRAG